MTSPPPTCRCLPAPAVTRRRRRRCPPAIALRCKKVSLTHRVGTGAQRCCLLPTAICQSNMFAVNNIVTRCPPVHPPNGTRSASAPHPSEGGSRGYVQEMRDQVILLWMNGEDLNAVWIELLRHQKKFPCLQTCRRWIHLYEGEGRALIAGGQLAIISPSARSRDKTLSILLFIELFNPRPTSTKPVHMCIIATLQICRILDHGLVEPS